jgi:hypothetical protein
MARELELPPTQQRLPVSKVWKKPAKTSNPWKKPSFHFPILGRK